MRYQALSAAFLLAGFSALNAQTNPVKVAVAARFDLQGDSNVGALTNGWLFSGDGTVGRSTWLAAGDQPNSYTVSFTVAHFGWLSASFHFTPIGSGNVQLTLRGPWEQSTNNGLIYKQEVLFDACAAAGGVLPNGGFESVFGGIPTGWWRTYGTDGAVDTGPVPPVDGTNYLRVWSDGPMSCNLAVTGGVPVTLTVFARAVFPAGFTDMPRVLGLNTPAHRAARRYMRGINAGSFLEVPPGQNWGGSFTAQDFVNIRNQGFDHVRIPGGWNFYAGPAPDYAISNSYFARADFMVTNALNQGLGVILNIHYWGEFATNAVANTNEFYALWRQIAAYYSNSPPQLAFELFNEPSGPGSTTAMLNPIYAEAIRQIRLSNPGRTLFVGPSQWNGIPELSNLLLPASDTNLIATVHCYDPIYFTHQGAGWVGPDAATVGLVFPGPPSTPLAPAAGVGPWVTNWIADYNAVPAEGNPCSVLAFKTKLQLAAQWGTYYGRPVYIGEFGCYTNTDAVSRARFCGSFRQTAEGLGLGWAMWDWDGKFHYWDTLAGQPVSGMPAALLPPPQLATSAPGQINVIAAISKTIRLDRAGQLGPALQWSPIQTNILDNPNWLYGDPQAATSNAAFYRAVWLQ